MASQPVEVTEAEQPMQIEICSDRRVFRPLGRYGSGPVFVLNVTMTIKHVDVFRHELAGAGGWGHPLDREPAVVACMEGA